ncbi:myeloid leukemia factor isoform X3 [Bacillus rossius redtenbacheri]|uniref:myeloid leukemia factor isoform X3 n=1 Tax=Bacillus rossius redtenbacheri TaxID=93214 RepID=UPI002FDD46CB
MSLFGHFGLMDDENDPFFGGHLRHMNNFMSSMMGDPFSMMSSMGLGFPALGSSVMPAAQRRQQGGGGSHLLPIGFPSMGGMMQSFGPLGGANCHTFSQNTVMTMTSGPDGRPQVFQASSSTRTAPGGVKETKKTLCDSRTGTKKMAIGHHIGERAHIMEREQNLVSGERDEREELINLDEDEAEAFNQEFEHKSRQYVRGALTAGGGGRLPRQRDLPALPALPPASGRVRARDTHRSPAAVSSHSKLVELDEEAVRARKRDREPETAQPHEGGRVKVMKRSPVVVDSDNSDG